MIGLIVIAMWVALLATWAVLGVRWWLRRRRPTAVIFDGCEVCAKPATHELGETFSEGQGGYTGMIASYCKAHAPAEAVKVR